MDSSTHDSEETTSCADLVWKTYRLSVNVRPVSG
jgi:hypothetical protein